MSIDTIALISILLTQIAAIARTLAKVVLEFALTCQLWSIRALKT
jgi:hypothetical protein